MPQASKVKPVTFQDLARLEPRLTTLLIEAKAHRKDRQPDFCANEVFYGYAGHRPGLKERLSQLVGWESTNEGILKTSLAYDVAYDTIYDALPDCRGDCACTAIGRALMGDAWPR